MEIIKAYPLIFLLTVLLPFAGGIVGAYLGWDALQSRVKDEKHKNTVEDQLNNISRLLVPLTEKAELFKTYEQVLAAANEKDQYLLAVISQYERLKKAAETVESFRGHKESTEVEGLAETILNEIRSGLPPTRVDPNLPNNPLIIKAGVNIYRVLFEVPMRIPPRLEISGLPQGVSALVTEKSRFGFTVVFSPASVPVERFGFTADAEL